MGAVKSITHSYATNEYLFWHIERKELDKIKQLLDTHPQLINCDLTTTCKTTPLHRAVLNGQFDIAQLLIEDYKADVDFKTTAGETPLIAAAKRDNIELVQYLLDKGSNIDVIGKTGLTALDYAVLQGNYNCALELVKKVKVTKLKTPFEYFHIAAKYKYRWIDYDIVVEALQMAVPFENVRDFFRKPKKTFVDPVVDPRETWKNWIIRNIDFEDPPMVERSELPEDMQPQNVKFSKMRHFMTRMTISPMAQKVHLNPRGRDDIVTDAKMIEMSSGGGGELHERMEIQSAA